MTECGSRTGQSEAVGTIEIRRRDLRREGTAVTEDDISCIRRAGKVRSSDRDVVEAVTVEVARHGDRPAGRAVRSSIDDEAVAAVKARQFNRLAERRRG